MFYCIWYNKNNNKEGKKDHLFALLFNCKEMQCNSKTIIHTEREKERESGGIGEAIKERKFFICKYLQERERIRVWVK